MSDKCPLCGNRRSEDSLFCANCTKKVQSDYEVELPESIESETESKVETKTESNSDCGSNSDSNNVSNSELDSDFKKGTTTIIADDEIAGEPLKEEFSFKDKDANEIVNSEKSVIEEPVDENNSIENENYPKNKNKKGKKLLRTAFVILVLVGSYFVFDEVVLEKNLERSAWETAVKENSVNGYLSYIEKHPSGIHFDEAQEGLFNLKRTEASVWEGLKESENISELTDFISQFNNSPYLSLVEARLDSLSWIVSLKTNSAESYYEYLEFSRHGELKGDYIAEAQKRYDWLYQSTPVEDFELDSIRTTVSGFYSALSSLDHDGMYRFLADHVNRFFDSGGASRERITGELVMTAAQIDNSRINFAPVLEGVQYKRLGNGFYEVNVPLVKSYTESNGNILISGYIVHISLNSAFEISSIYETKPYSGAP